MVDDRLSAGSPAGPPSPLWLALERHRALWELWQFVAAEPALRLAPRGTGRPVLVLPGFLSDDSATAALREYLNRIGHSAHSWDLGVNLGPTRAILDGLESRVTEVASSHGQPVSVVGISLGGVFARDLARRMPDSVRQVITLGSPFRITSRSQSHLSGVFDAMSHLHVDRSRFSVFGGPRKPLPVPSTAIYTRSDGVVAWQACVDDASPAAENIEVVGSHSGLAHLPSAVYAVADRLGQPDGSWHRFTPPPLLRYLYPTLGRPAA